MSHEWRTKWVSRASLAHPAWHVSRTGMALAGARGEEGALRFAKVRAESGPKHALAMEAHGALAFGGGVARRLRRKPLQRGAHGASPHHRETLKMGAELIVTVTIVSLLASIA